jgi:hypothetical protein
MQLKINWYRGKFQETCYVDMDNGENETEGQGKGGEGEGGDSANDAFTKLQYNHTIILI